MVDTGHLVLSLRAHPQIREKVDHTPCTAGEGQAQHIGELPLFFSPQLIVLSSILMIIHGQNFAEKKAALTDLPSTDVLYLPRQLAPSRTFVYGVVERMSAHNLHSCLSATRGFMHCFDCNVVNKIIL